MFFPVRTTIRFPFSTSLELCIFVKNKTDLLTVYFVALLDCAVLRNLPNFTQPLDFLYPPAKGCLFSLSTSVRFGRCFYRRTDFGLAFEFASHLL